MHGLEYVAPGFIDTHRELADLLPESVARACNALPQPSSGTALKVLITDPLDFEAIDLVDLIAGTEVEVGDRVVGTLEEPVDPAVAGQDIGRAAVVYGRTGDQYVGAV